MKNSIMWIFYVVFIEKKVFHFFLLCVFYLYNCLSLFQRFNHVAYIEVNVRMHQWCRMFVLDETFNMDFFYIK